MNHFDISNCSGDVCVLHRGQHADVTVRFLASQDSNKLDFQFVAHGKKIDFPVPGIDYNGCDYVKCPIVKGQTYEYKLNLTVPEHHPFGKANLTMKMNGDHGVVACLTFSAEVN